MFGQWALGEEALGEIDGPPVPPPVILAYRARVWFTTETTTATMAPQWVAEVDVFVAVKTTVSMFVETSKITVGI